MLPHPSSLLDRGARFTWYLISTEPVPEQEEIALWTPPFGVNICKLKQSRARSQYIDEEIHGILSGKPGKCCVDKKPPC
jgi:hypothetical protein